VPLRDFLVIFRIRWRTILASMLLVLGATAATTLAITYLPAQALLLFSKSPVHSV